MHLLPYTIISYNVNNYMYAAKHVKSYYVGDVSLLCKYPTGYAWVVYISKPHFRVQYLPLPMINRM